MTDSWIKALILVCLFGTVILVADVMVERLVRSQGAKRAVNFRLKLIGEGRSHGEVMTLLRRTTDVSAGLPMFLQGAARKLERMLIASRITWPRAQVMTAIAVAPFALFLFAVLAMVVSGMNFGAGRLLMLATFCIVAGAFLPIMFLQAKATRARRKVQEQFPVALDVFVRGLRAGHPIASALDLLTVEMQDPIGSEFGMVVDEVTYGSDLRDALQSMADRWDLDDMRMFVVSLSVQSETGGNLAEILENLSQVIRERQTMMLKVRALSSEGRMTAVMLTALPILAFSALFVFNPSFYLDVADDPAFIPGFAFLIILYVTGFVWIRKLVDLKV
ncbi:MAG: type II secretion system F family protein [Sphingomicrobium sp.]